jgi:hypothetical protein
MILSNKFMKMEKRQEGGKDQFMSWVREGQVVFVGRCDCPPIRMGGGVLPCPYKDCESHWLRNA